MRPRARPAILLALWLALPGQSGGAPTEPGFRAELDEVLKRVAAYDFGRDRGAVIALSKLARTTHGQPAQRRELADRLAALLATKAPAGAKDLACRELSLIASAEQVPVLAGLLADPRLANMARYALERIPGPAADEALRKALATAQGDALLGVIQSIGTRRDPSAVDALKARLAGSDRAVAGAAAQALGKIATPTAVKALSEAWNTQAGRACPAVGEACLVSAERLATQGDREAAAALYDRLRAPDAPLPMRRAATRGAILARGSADLLLEQLRGDQVLFSIGLSLVREMAGPEIAAAVAGEIPRLTVARQILVAQALADRGDPSASPALLALAEKGDPAVRATALLALAKLGGKDAATVLIQAAAGDDPVLAEAAKTALATIPGRELDTVLSKALESANPKVRRTGAEILGQRRATGAADALFAVAADPDPSVRLAAIKALGATAALADLGRLGTLVIKAPGPAERAAAEEATGAACTRINDQDACAGKLLALMPADAEGKSALVRTLSQVGGAKALGAVCAAMQDPDERVQDAVVRSLSNWSTAEPMDRLAAIAQDSPNRKHKLLALRGYIHLVGRSNAAPGQKLAMCRQAMQWADRDDERRLVLAALGALSTQPALELALASLDQPELNSEAASAAIAVGRKLLAADPGAVAQAMAQVVAKVKNPGLKRQAEELLNKARGK